MVVGGVVVAPGASELVLPIALAVTKGLTADRPGADVRDLPVAVGLDHRGRPAADGGRRARLTWTRASGGERRAGCDGCDEDFRLNSALTVPTVALIPPMQEGMPSSRVVRAGRRLLRSLAVVAAIAARRSSPGTAAVADEPAEHHGRRRAGAGLAEAAGPRGRGRGRRPSAGSRPPSGDAVRIADRATSPTSRPARPCRSPSGHEQTEDGGTGCTRSSAPSVAPGADHRRRATPPAVTNQVTVALVAPAGAPATGTRATRQQIVAAGRRAGRAASGPSRPTAPSPSASPPPRLDQHAVPAARTRRRCGTRSPRRSASSPARASTCCSTSAERAGTAPTRWPRSARRSTSGGRLYVRDAIPSVIAHELGHNFGLAPLLGAAVRRRRRRRPLPHRRLPRLLRRHGRLVGADSARSTPCRPPRLGVLPRSSVQPVSVYGTAGSVTLAPLSGRTGVAGAPAHRRLGRRLLARVPRRPRAATPGSAPRPTASASRPACCCGAATGSPTPRCSSTARPAVPRHGTPTCRPR